MRLYFMTVCCIVLACFLFLRLQGNRESLAIDDEQTGLNENIIINFSHVVAENTPKGAAVAKFAELVYEKSDGEIVVEVHPNGVLYNDETELKALQAGTVQMIAPTFSKITNTVPSWQVLDLPFLFNTLDEADALFNGTVGQQLLAQLQDVQLKGLTFWHNGFKQIATQQAPILNATDFEGVHVRTMASAVLEQQFELLGAVPTATTFNELYSAIEQQKVMAQENTLSNLYSKGFYELQTEITLSNHGVLAYVVLMNLSFWESLSTKHQQIIEQALQQMNRWQYNFAIQMNEHSLEQLQQKSMVHIYEPSVEQLDEWRKKIQPLYEQHKKYEQLLQVLTVDREQK